MLIMMVINAIPDEVQWEQNEGKCGICGDPHHVEEPRPHEAGGLYAKGIISRHYSVGQGIDIEIELTANHYGRFEIYKVQLPPYITCTQCVLQWNYYTGNQWGACPNGTQAQGCGKSETFRNCADVAIHTSTGGAMPPLFVDQQNPYQLYYKDYTRPAPYNVVPLVIREQVCVPNNLYKMIPGVREWCQTNCLRYPPNCPHDVCQCPTTCEAIGEYKGKLGADVNCMDQCLVYSSDKCPKDQCACYEE
ncbi:hypothetical protein NQ314_019167 [Rhamnusium bicolor]|uniref:Chitin-binding type-4 domain-containing protein n=1 Tax=Rhamnusium bicolor TaxID=1586634 RepID=A0AAV8WNJ6_9CUCU|nr:hypothetical protein NQ314_019167 [Rhamnusium bicolor]